MRKYLAILALVLFIGAIGYTTYAEAQTVVRVCTNTSGLRIVGSSC